MSDFRTEKTFKLEERCLHLLKGLLGIEAVCRNNSENITAFDFLYQTKETECYVDFQYSADFHKYGEIRIDILSYF